MTDRFGAAPNPTFRLIPSRFPPIGLFETVAAQEDLAAVLELAGWTNDRLVAERIARLPRDQWVYGRTNASIVMAAFLHAAPGGGRFNTGDLGAWYASGSVVTAAAEVAHHLRREAVAIARPGLQRIFRCYTARLDGEFLDIRGMQRRPEAYAPDSHAASQALGESVRAAGGFGLLWDSIRHAGGICAVAYQPRAVLDVVQAEHYEITVATADKRVDVRRLTA